MLYDSRGDESTLDNHKDRVEVREALKNGVGEDIRMSDTVGKELYYYAVAFRRWHSPSCGKKYGQSDKHGNSDISCDGSDRGNRALHLYIYSADGRQQDSFVRSMSWI